MATYLAFDEVTNTGLGHDGDGDGLHDVLDHAGVRHTRHATLGSDIGGNTLEGHDGGSTGLLSNASLHRIVISIAIAADQQLSAYLFRIDNVHDHAALQHLGQTGLDREVIGGTVLLSSHCE